MPGPNACPLIADTTPIPATTIPATRMQRRRLATRARLVATARELFSEHGYDGTTMDMVADRADLARTTVFNHFPSKDALLLAALADQRRIVRDRLGQIRVGQAATGDRIRDAITQWAAAYQADDRSGAALVRAWVQAGGPYLPEATDTATLFAAALAVGQDSGEVRGDVDSEVAGLVLLDAAVGALVRWAADEPAQPHRSDLESAMLAAAEVVLQGILANLAPLPGARTGGDALYLRRGR